MILWEDIRIYFWVYLVIQALASAGFCFYLADQKGRGPTGWAVAGVLFGFFALVAAAGVPPRSELELVEGTKRDSRLKKKCPLCAEYVSIEARKCGHCGYEFADKTRIVALLDKISKQEEGLAPIARTAQRLLDELSEEGR